MSWARFGGLVVLSVALVGCSSTNEKEQAIKDMNVKIQTLTNDNNLLADKNTQLAGENAVMVARYESAQGQIEGLNREKQQYGALIASKESQIAREREITRQAELRAEQARKEQPSSAFNLHMPPYGAPVAGGPAGAGAAGPAAPAAAGKGSYYLRIISLPGNAQGEKTAREMASHLASQGIANATPRRSGNFWVVDIGAFSSIRSSDAVALKDKVRAMKYKGIEQFRSAYFAQY